MNHACGRLDDRRDVNSLEFYSKLSRYFFSISYVARVSGLFFRQAEAKRSSTSHGHRAQNGRDARIDASRHADNEVFCANSLAVCLEESYDSLYCLFGVM